MIDNDFFQIRYNQTIPFHSASPRTTTERGAGGIYPLGRVFRLIVSIVFSLAMRFQLKCNHHLTTLSPQEGGGGARHPPSTSPPPSPQGGLAWLPIGGGWATDPFSSRGGVAQKSLNQIYIYIYIYTRRSSALKRAFSRSSRSQDVSQGRSDMSQGMSDARQKGADLSQGGRRLRQRGPDLSHGGSDFHLARCFQLSVMHLSIYQSKNKRFVEARSNVLSRHPQ